MFVFLRGVAGGLESRLRPSFVVAAVFLCFFIPIFFVCFTFILTAGPSLYKIRAVLYGTRISSK